MSNPVNDFLSDLAAAITPARRRLVYRLVTAVLLVLALHQVVTADESATYLQALALALGIVPSELAARNTPKE